MTENVLNVIGVVMLSLLTAMLALALVWMIPEAIESMNDTIYRIKQDKKQRRK
jgi:hypothetical protein